MNSQILLLETFIYFCGFYLILSNVYIKSEHHNIKMVLNILFRIILILISFFVDNIIAISFLSATIVDIISLRLLFKNIKAKSILSLYSLFYSIYIIISSVITFLANDYEELSVLLVYIGIIVGFSLISIAIIVSLCKPTVISNVTLIPTNVKRICIISIISSTFVVNFILYINVFKNIAEWSTATKLLLILFIITIGSVFPSVIANSIGKVFYSRQARRFEEQVALQAKHYEDLAENNFELRRFKHDYKNILIGVEELLRDGKTEMAIEVLNQGNSTLSDAFVLRYETGNNIVDAILYEKSRAASDLGIDIIFEGAIPENVLTPADLCILFGKAWFSLRTKLSLDEFQPGIVTL